MNRIIGIDPGKDGAVVALSEGGGLVFCADATQFCDVKAKPKEYRYQDMWGVLRSALSFTSPMSARVVIEDVCGYRGQGGPASFEFGRGVGLWQMAISELNTKPSGIKPMLVRPEVWESRYCIEEHVPAGCKMTKLARKKALMEIAGEKWPGLYDGVTRQELRSGLADAALIAEHGRRTAGASE